MVLSAKGYLNVVKLIGISFLACNIHSEFIKMIYNNCRSIKYLHIDGGYDINMWKATRFTLKLEQMICITCPVPVVNLKMIKKLSILCVRVDLKLFHLIAKNCCELELLEISIKDYKNSNIKIWKFWEMIEMYITPCQKRAMDIRFRTKLRYHCTGMDYSWDDTSPIFIALVNSVEWNWNEQLTNELKLQNGITRITELSSSLKYRIVFTKNNQLKFTTLYA